MITVSENDEPQLDNSLKTERKNPENQGEIRILFLVHLSWQSVKQKIAPFSLQLSFRKKESSEENEGERENENDWLVVLLLNSTTFF